MKNIKIFLVVASLFTASSLFAETAVAVKPQVKGEKIILNGDTYDMSAYVYKEGLKSIATADWAYVFSMPEANGGDWCDMYILKNGNYAISYGRYFYEFNNTEADNTPQIVIQNPKIEKIIDDDQYGHFGDNIDIKGLKLGYCYADNKNGDQCIIVYGKK